MRTGMMRYEVTRWLINGEIRRRSTENQEYAEAIAGRSTGNQVYVGPIAKNRQKNEPKTRSGNPSNEFIANANTSNVENAEKRAT